MAKSLFCIDFSKYRPYNKSWNSLPMIFNISAPADTGGEF